MTIRQRAAAIWNSGARIVQLALAVHAGGLAVILLEPIDTFDSAVAYRWMAARATESHWAVIGFCVAGLGGLSVIVANFHLRAASAFVCSVFTGAIAYGYMTSNPDGTGWWTYTVLTLLSYWLLLHCVWGRR